ARHALAAPCPSSGVMSSLLIRLQNHTPFLVINGDHELFQQPGPNSPGEEIVRTAGSRKKGSLYVVECQRAQPEFANRGNRKLIDLLGKRACPGRAFFRLILRKELVFVDELSKQRERRVITGVQFEPTGL